MSNHFSHAHPATIAQRALTASLRCAHRAATAAAPVLAVAFHGDDYTPAVDRAVDRSVAWAKRAHAHAVRAARAASDPTARGGAARAKARQAAKAARRAAKSARDTVLFLLAGGGR